MRAFVEEREKNTEWLEQGVRELVFGALHEEPLCAPVYADKMHVSTEAIEDTMARKCSICIRNLAKRYYRLNAARVEWISGVSAAKSLCATPFPQLC